MLRIMEGQAVRVWGATAGLAILAGAAVMLGALIAAPGSWLLGYVSEAGTAAAPWATAYRWGLIVLSGGVALLALALRPQSRPVAALLGGTAVFAATSGSVPCTDRCPLPPFEPTTPSDVIHSAASIVGMVLLAGAMLLVAVSAAFRPAARRLAGVHAALTIPLGGALGLIMLFVGRGQAGAILERIMLAVAASWLIGTSILTILRSSVRLPPWMPQPNPSSTGSRSSNAASRS
ncbi:DUF998 domain-containing protein [Couchioplanes azureus]|uniref:DUF998 domain-containing protein n=1 Tax=Couchioplanes caeruleus TaxID=56438 RepID=UPI0016711058|nr:DUF998 domain-containing protein [Couchioplanes caeruleus]GGQ57904.1 hypothetical protein GCM10010166_29670 [Couchioplanes caeruleus subsp. azureus]